VHKLVMSLSIAGKGQATVHTHSLHGGHKKKHLVQHARLEHLPGTVCMPFVMQGYITAASGSVCHTAKTENMTL